MSGVTEIREGDPILSADRTRVIAHFRMDRWFRSASNHYSVATLRLPSVFMARAAEELEPTRGHVTFHLIEEAAPALRIWVVDPDATLEDLRACERFIILNEGVVK